MPVSKVSIVSLGCPKNTADTDLLAGTLRNAGLDVVEDPSKADAVIVNTCGFIRAACEESLDVIMELGEMKRGGEIEKLLVCGCMGERYGEELRRELPEADRLFGLVEQDRDDILADLLGGRDVQVEAAARAVPSTPYAYVKISEGCDRKCAYCTIPWIRGPLRSRPREEIEGEVATLAGSGVREIVLVGQDTAAWGDDLPGKPRVWGLVGGLAESFDVWFRLMYLQPDRVGEELVTAVAAHDNVCDYFDIPFQHASSSVLRSMRRPGDSPAFLGLLERIRTRMPAAAIRTTLIVGFPGETERDFEELADFVRAARFDYAGVFPYSPEAGTEALLLPAPIEEAVARERHRMLVDLIDEIGWSKVEQRIGSRLDVLVEGESGEQEYPCEGRSQFQAPEVDGVCLLEEEEKTGALVRAKVVATEGYDMICRKV